MVDPAVGACAHRFVNCQVNGPLGTGMFCSECSAQVGVAVMERASPEGTITFRLLPDLDNQPSRALVSRVAAEVDARLGIPLADDRELAASVLNRGRPPLNGYGMDAARSRLQRDASAKITLASTHSGFDIACEGCGSHDVGVVSSVGFSVQSGGWGSVDLVCASCGERTEIFSFV